METTFTSGSIERHLESLTVRGRSSQTVRAKGADLRLLHGAVGDIPIEQFPDAAMRFLNDQRISKAATSIRRYLGSYRMYANWAGLHDAMADYMPPKPAQPIPHPLPEGIEGVERLINLAKHSHHKTLIALCGLAGLRVSEAVAARVEHLDLVDRMLTVRGKGDRTRIVPVGEACLRVLVERAVEVASPDERFVPLHERAARRTIAKLGEVAGLARPIASHDLRATFATAAYAKTHNLRAVQELLGHADSRTTQVYTGISVSAMREAADVLEEVR